MFNELPLEFLLLKKLFEFLKSKDLDVRKNCSSNKVSSKMKCKSTKNSLNSMETNIVSLTRMPNTFTKLKNEGE